MNTTSFNTYLSSHIYDTLVPQDHFLRQLNQRIDWSTVTQDLKQLAHNEHGGRPRYHPTLLFKMLFLSFLFDTSDRDTEELCTSNVRCKYFLGLDITKEAPDFTTLSVFRTELLHTLGVTWLNQVFEQILTQAKEQAIQFGTVYALDSTHTLSDVDQIKDHERKVRGQTPRDTPAAWGVKGTETKQTPDGQSVEVVKYFHGYKSHLLAETTHGLITNLSTSPGNTADVNAGEHLLLKQMTTAQRARIGTLTADKAYGDATLIGILEWEHHIKTAFGLNGQFFKGEFKCRWDAYQQDPVRVAARKQRSVVERVNADLKDNHGLRRCRYLGQLKYQLQVTLSALAHNLKTIILLLSGARFRPV